LAPDQHIIQVVSILALGGWWANHHRQQVSPFAIESRTATGEIHLQRVIDILFIYSQFAA
jgi:hypothetical protein